MQVSPADEMPGANPTVAHAVYAAAGGPKELMEVDGGNFGLVHHSSRWFDDASDVQRDFLLDTLT